MDALSELLDATDLTVAQIAKSANIDLAFCEEIIFSPNPEQTAGPHAAPILKRALLEAGPGGATPVLQSEGRRVFMNGVAAIMESQDEWVAAEIRDALIDRGVSISTTGISKHLNRLAERGVVCKTGRRKVALAAGFGGVARRWAATWKLTPKDQRPEQPHDGRSNRRTYTDAEMVLSMPKTPFTARQMLNTLIAGGHRTTLSSVQYQLRKLSTFGIVEQMGGRTRPNGAPKENGGRRHALWQLKPQETHE